MPRVTRAVMTQAGWRGVRSGVHDLNPGVNIAGTAPANDIVLPVLVPEAATITSWSASRGRRRGGR